MIYKVVYTFAVSGNMSTAILNVFVPFKSSVCSVTFKATPVGLVCTFTLHLASLPLLVLATISVVPFAIPVTNPFSETVATLLLFDSKYILLFTFAVGEVLLSDNLVIGEIQDNYPQFDFHQCQESILFKQSENDNVATMFGADSKIVAKDKTEAKKCLLSLVKGVAKAGKYCFMRAGREDDMIKEQKRFIKWKMEGECYE